MSAVHSCGGQFFYSIDNQANWVELSQTIAITPPTSEHGEMETTLLNSTTCERTFRSGWRDNGEALVRLRWLDSDYETIQNAATELLGRDYDFKIEFPLEVGDATQAILSWDGFVKSIAPAEFSVDSDDSLEQEITVRVSGAITFTVGSA